MNCNNIILCKRFLISFLKNPLFCANGRFNRHRCLTHFVKPHKVNKDKINHKKILVYNNYCRKISNSNSDPKSSERVTEERDENILDDLEFKSILKDFSKDFGLGSDSEKVLDDIKKSLDEANVSDKNTSSSETAKKLNSCDESKEKYSFGKEKYKEFSDSDSKVIESYEDIESGACEDEITYHIDQKFFNMPEVKPKRGISGVYDVGELVEILQEENLVDVAVISISKEFHYADFLVLATAKSLRHSNAVSEYVIKLYKMKKHQTDPFIIVEGEKLSNWKAIDMGNIVLHIFLEETRAFYDIESLWLFDSDFDSGGTLKPDPVFDAIQEQMAFFNTLQDPSSKECANETT